MTDLADVGQLGLDVQVVDLAVHIQTGLAVGQSIVIFQISELIGHDYALNVLQAQLALAQSFAGVGVTAGSQGAVLHGIMEQAAEEDLGDHLTGSGSAEVTAGDVLQHTLTLGNLGGLQFPALRIGELTGLAIAQGAEQHDHQLIAGHGSAGIEGGGRGTDNDTGVLAVVDVTLCPVVAVQVVELALLHVGVVVEVLVLDIAGGDAVNEYRGLCAVQGVGGLEGTIFKTLENFQLVQHVDSSLIGIAVVHVGELSGAGGSHERETHNEGQHHCENLFQISHSGFFLLLIF